MKFVLLSCIASVIVAIVCVIVFSFVGVNVPVLIAAGCVTYMVAMAVCGIAGLLYALSSTQK
ncbi:hypothetical protein XaC1_506 [Xanthomonas phage XaC1]|nr:hypothetical protein XaC1_506 [Xanthomonas phage XaC1]